MWVPEIKLRYPGLQILCYLSHLDGPMRWKISWISESCRPLVLDQEENTLRATVSQRLLLGAGRCPERGRDGVEPCKRGIWRWIQCGTSITMQYRLNTSGLGFCYIRWRHRQCTCAPKVPVLGTNVPHLYAAAVWRLVDEVMNVPSVTPYRKTNLSLHTCPIATWYLPLCHDIAGKHQLQELDAGLTSLHNCDKQINKYV